MILLMMKVVFVKVRNMITDAVVMVGGNGAGNGGSSSF